MLLNVVRRLTWISRLWVSVLGSSLSLGPFLGPKHSTATFQKRHPERHVTLIETV